jgi:signal transduction histidine kinase
VARRWALRWPTLREAGAVVVLALAYFAAAKLAQTLRYTASVSAIWPPVGLGIAALYLFGLRLWPGVFLGELLVNANLLFEGSNPPPLGSVMGQQVGNMAEVIFGAWLLGRLIGPRAKLERASEVGWMTVAVGTAAAISATVGTISMLAGGVITVDEIPTFWRTWVLGDTAGALVVLPLCLTWADPARAWRRVRRFEGALVIGLVAVLASVAVLSDAPLTYLTFPALIWAAFRFGPPGVTLATALMAGVTIGITADQVGAFYKQPIDNRTLSTQLYILVGSLTALFLSAVISERERSTTELAASKRRELERAIDERRRIARELHDSVSQTLFSSTLHSRAAQKALAGASEAPQVRQQLQAIDELTKRAQSEMRRFIFEWGPSEVGDGLVPALTRHVSSFAGNGEFRIRVEGPTHPLPVQLRTETQLYGIAREAVANVVRHAGAGYATIRVEATDGEVVLEIADDGCGFDPQGPRAGRSFGLESMRSRAAEMGADFAVISAPGRGTVVRIELPTEDERDDV